jgi:diguanylate cyclase (GGDEF)-like protein
VYIAADNQSMFWNVQSRRVGEPWLVTLGVLSLAFAVSGLSTTGTNFRLVGLDAAFALGLVGLGWVLGRIQARPEWLLLLPVGCDVVIAGLRQAQGGSTSGYSPLAILPVVWVGLLYGRRFVALITVVTGAMFALPIALIGAPLYPDSGWRSAVLWVAVALVVGTAVRNVMASQRRQTALANRRASELDRLVETQTTIATARFDVQAVLDTIVEEARALTQAAGAVVELPEGDEMVYTAGAGAATVHVGVRIARAGSMAGLALTTRETLRCRDSELDPRVDRKATTAVGARSMIVVPLVHDSRAEGVLKVYSAAVDAFDDGHVRTLELLASMIAAALARAALMGRLAEQAGTDELTGLMNRREWDSRLEQAIARSRRSGLPVSVVVLDVDGLKQVNDRDGHAAGDEYLKAVSGAWAHALRETDALGRVGGDEFAVLLEGVEELSARDTLRRLDRSLAPGHNASAGVATWRAGEDAAALVARADAAMYEAKRIAHARGRRTAGPRADRAA